MGRCKERGKAYKIYTGKKGYKGYKGHEDTRDIWIRGILPEAFP